MRTSLPPRTDAVLIGRVAELLAELGEIGLTDSLELLVSELGLRSAVLRDIGPDSARASTAGLRAVAGEPLRAVPEMRVLASGDASTATVELPIRAGGRDLAVLIVVGARPSQLPVLRALSAVLGLALSRPAAAASDGVIADLVAAADGEADDAADRLHDGPLQSLVVAHYAAEAAARGGDPIAAREAVSAALVDLRRTLWHLRPRALSGGLADTLELLSGRLSEAGRPPLGFVLDEVLANGLSRAVVSTVYRLVQSVSLPAEAPPVRVTLRREGPTAVLDVDGGLPLPDPQRWISKARALGGSLTSDGTHTRLTVPLTAPRTKATS